MKLRECYSLNVRPFSTKTTHNTTPSHYITSHENMPRNDNEHNLRMKYYEKIRQRKINGKIEKNEKIQHKRNKVR